MFSRREEWAGGFVEAGGVQRAEHEEDIFII
jgi:hypothetical protein